MALDGSYEGPKNRCQHIFPFMCNLPLSHVANGCLTLCLPLLSYHMVNFKMDIKLLS